MHGARVAFAPIALAIALALGLPGAATGQTTILIQGRVVARGGSPDVEGARVELRGHDVTETTAAGLFRFESVASGDYDLHVTALGYAPATLRLSLTADTTITVQLEPVPFRLDSLVVTTRRITVEGRVRDSARDLPLRGADVYTSHGPPIRTGAHGRFRLKDVWENSPVAVTVSAFGYLPADTTLYPAAGDRYLFDLRTDPVAERMIARQVSRIEKRAAGRLSALMRPLGREALLRSGGGSLRDILRARYSIHLRRLRCVLVDDRVLPPSVDGPILGTMNPEDVERIEFLFNGAMLRVYTREYLRRMVSREVELRAPVYVAIVNPPLCE